MRLGSYEILACIARGGMASVWAARQHGARGFSRLVALKTILPELATPDLDGMFLDEASVTARIHHPNVCEVFELIEHGGVLALSMEWVDGDTLNNIIQGRPQDPQLDPRLAAHIVAQVAAGLHAAHELRDDHGTPFQLVHRDVSPQNILISRGGHVKVTDFGVAKTLGGVRETTAIGKVKGKLSYMSPEQAQGQELDRRSDIFSLGVVLYLATVGSHPFRRNGESRHQQFSRLLSKPVKKPSKRVPGYPPELEEIVLRALERDPADRFATADEMSRRLQGWILASGPPITEHRVAEVMLERAGAAILERSERIANLMCATEDDRSGSAALPATIDPTLVPTTSRSEASIPAWAAISSARATLLAVSTTLTAGAIAIAASFVFSAPVEPPNPPAAAAAQPVPADTPTSAIVVAPKLPEAPSVGAPASPPASEPGADETSAPRPSATTRSKARTSKSKKASVTRSRVSRRDELYSIKPGR
jgi:serine/threonine protein kinase